MDHSKEQLDSQVLFSVIVPVYNSAPYLQRCIDSILKQSEPSFECILIDDGSTDESGAICDAYAELDPRIVVIHSENRGVSAARNLGLDRAVGEYIVFVDSDDWVNERYLQEMVDSDADYLCQLFVICNENEKQIKPFSVDCENETRISADKLIGILKGDGARYPFSKRFRREIIFDNGIRFDDTIDHSEDTLFIIDYLFHCNNASFDRAANYNYVKYSSHQTLSNYISLERFCTTCFAREKIAKRFFPQGACEYRALYYYLIGGTYIHYLWSVYFTEKHGLLENYFFGIRLMKNKDFRAVLEYSPDAVWALPVSPRMIHAFQKNDKTALLRACVIEKFRRLLRG